MATELTQSMLEWTANATEGLRGLSDPIAVFQEMERVTKDFGQQFPECSKPELMASTAMFHVLVLDWGRA